MAVQAECGAGETAIDGHEVIELFGGRELLFGCRHVPAEQTGTGVVICPPVFGDGVITQQERRLGRWLASAGIVTQRFDHRGTGRSEGDIDEMHLDDLVADARRAVDLLDTHCNVRRLGIAGVGVGGWVAIRLAREHDATPLVLWEPRTDPWREPELLATSLGQDLFRSSGGFVDEVGAKRRPILVVGTGLQSAVERWRAKGFMVDVLDGLDVSDDAALSATTAWMAAQ